MIFSCHLLESFHSEWVSGQHWHLHFGVLIIEHMGKCGVPLSLSACWPAGWDRKEAEGVITHENQWRQPCGRHISVKTFNFTPEYKEYIYIYNQGTWGQTLICIKCYTPITRLSMWQKDLIVEPLAQVFLAGICAKGQAKDEPDIWF